MDAMLQLFLGAVVFPSYALGAWALTAYLGFTRAFPWRAGALSNWMVWVAFGVMLQLSVSKLRGQIEGFSTATQAGFAKTRDRARHISSAALFIVDRFRMRTNDANYGVSSSASGPRFITEELAQL